MRTDERGFSLIELLVCTAILTVVAAASFGAFAAVARNAVPGLTRDLALMVGENALARGRAAVAYASSATQDGTALLDDRSWALHPGETRYVAGAELRGNAVCGSRTATVLRLPVSVTYDTSLQRLTVVVTYPRDPCSAQADGSFAPGNGATLSLVHTLPPPVYPPGQVVHHDVAVPARM